MEGETIKPQENTSNTARILASFFSDLPEETTNPITINRNQIDELIERGISVDDLLLGFVQRGYFLHGTERSDIATLEPRQANDTSGAEENTRNAIYATNNPKIAIFCAIAGKRSGTTSFNVNTSVMRDESTGVETRSEETFFGSSYPIPENSIGFVYILPIETFESAGGIQFTSSTAVMARYIIPVSINDFPYKIERIETQN